ncbi:unnamed protein product [Didymodactylos carnosus]|uniref:Anti-silencing function protein 1 n=1 Tax=Didymodactylos carnosus TaxID=1234261 RepID=A0A813NY23_9BILA|nr:unnamed protein product [Didymodactylos carnosus]CAF0744499.1 unnamed protein product [Didymodactylos carnosus]CAF3503317.1 unnamed protein product [Didymodactylos carnosus]CAF3523118.1 unnamed protein product [Didymodactylos carnosus]
MVKVLLTNVVVHNNPAKFSSSFNFEIQFECLEQLTHELEFKLIYVGSAETCDHDQVLDVVVIDAVPAGTYKFLFEAPAPDKNKIPVDDVVGVTVVLVKGMYRDHEFVRVGYYVLNEYDDPELKENPPTKPDFDKLSRNIAVGDPRVTTFPINWEDNPDCLPFPPLSEEDQQRMADAMQSVSVENDDNIVNQFDSSLDDHFKSSTTTTFDNLSMINTKTTDTTAVITVTENNGDVFQTTAA